MEDRPAKMKEEEKADSQGEWRTVKDARARAKSSDPELVGAQAKTKLKQSARKPTPSQPQESPDSKVGVLRQSAPHPGGVDQGDGRVVFMQLRRYLVNEAPKAYVFHMVLRLDELARTRRFKTCWGNLEKKERSTEEVQVLRECWTDEAPPILQTKYQGLISYWDYECVEHVERMFKLMREWVLEEHLPQEEIETRLRLFHFVNAPSNHEATADDTNAGGSYGDAVRAGLVGQTSGAISEEQQRLIELCLQPVEETLQLRERMDDEDKALLMILNRQIEVPYPPSFLVQSMDARELACFTYIFMATEYPLYAHLAPGQKSSPNLSKQALLTLIHMGDEAAPPQKMEIREFKAALSRITLDMKTRVLTVTFKGRKSAARWVNWQVPWAMTMLPLVDYEQQRERAKTTHALVKLDYYRFSVVVRKGTLTSKDMHWLLTRKLGLQVQSMAHPETSSTGVNDKQWTVTIKAKACPTNLRNMAFISIGETEILVHHHEVHVNWPCATCYSPEHPTKYCRTGDDDRGDTRKKHAVAVGGKLPSRLGQGTKIYGNIAHPTPLSSSRHCFNKIRNQSLSTLDRIFQGFKTYIGNHGHIQKNNTPDTAQGMGPASCTKGSGQRSGVGHNGERQQRSTDQSRGGQDQGEYS